MGAGPVDAIAQASGAAIGSIFSGKATAHAADKQLQASREAEAFQRQQAEATFKQQETDRAANYAQWAARQGRMNSIGSALGYGTGTPIPAYVPMTDPRYTSQGLGRAPVPPPAMTPQGPAGDPAQAAVRARHLNLASGLGY